MSAQLPSASLRSCGDTVNAAKRGRAFFIGPQLFNSDVLTEGDTYSVYFIEEPLTLLSLEHVAQA